VECDNLEDPENGEAFFSSKLFGSTAIYQCSPVFILVGKETRMGRPMGNGATCV